MKKKICVDTKSMSVNLNYKSNKSNNILTIGNATFTVLNKLGEGTFGEVYKVQYQGAEYALKYIQNSSKEGILSLREIDIMSRLRHPHLMHAEKIFSSYLLNEGKEKATKVGILMPLAKGGDLLEKNRDPNFTLEERLTVLYQVCTAVNFMHQRGYLHLDIKPMNILLFNNKFAKLSDFGLSLVLQKSAQNKISKFYPVQLATVDHRAPEIMNGDLNYTSASDVWSLGITFIETLAYGNSIFKTATGQYFSEKDYTVEKVSAVYEKLLTPRNIRNTLTEYLRISHLSKGLRNKIFEIIEKMLDFNPNTRATMEDILEFFNYLFENSSLIDKKDRYIPEGFTISSNFNVSNNNLKGIDSELVKIGFNKMNEVASRLRISTETLFLAADIYHRTLPYSNLSNKKEEKERNIKNITFSAIVSFYLAFKMIEPFFDDPVILSNLSGNIFPSEYLMLGESIIVSALDGIIYPDNLFVCSTTFKRLLKAYTILPDKDLYSRIDLVEWYQLSSQESEKEGTFHKYIPYRDFLSLIA